MSLASDLSRLTRSREAVAAFAVCGAILCAALLASVFGGRAVQATAANACVLLVLVIGLGVFVGSTGLLSFGHAAFAALAGYASALLSLPVALKARLLPDLPAWLAATALPVPAAIFCAVLATAVIGALAGLAIVRLSGAAAAIATLGLLIMANSVLTGAVQITRGAQALYGIPAGAGLATAALAACGCFLLARLFKETRHGLMARASRDDATAARSIGIGTKRARFLPWAISVAVVALGGALLAHRLTVISPKEFYFAQSFEWLVVLIVGGMLSVSGNVAGAALIVGVVEVLRRVEQGVTLFGVTTPQVFGLTDAGLALAILVALVWRGNGLAGNAEADALPVFRRLPSWLDRPDTHRPALAPRSVEGALVVDGVSKSYGGVVALTGVSFEIAPGAIVGVIGPNGSGKSTLIGCVSGVLALSSGRVSIGADDITGQPPERIVRKGLARTFQNIRLFQTLTVVENVEAAFAGSGRETTRIAARREALAILERCGLLPLAGRGATTLSYGDQRRLEIARALACAPRFLLLDEPAAGMNETETAALAQQLRDIRDETGIGVLIIEHDLDLVMTLCDRIVVLDKGRVLADSPPSEIAGNDRVVEAYLGGRKDKARPATARSSRKD